MLFLACHEVVKQFDSANFLTGLGVCVLALLLGVVLDDQLAERVLAYLEWAETRSCNGRFQDDIRMAWMIVLFLQQGVSIDPVVLASYRIFGVHADKLQQKIEDRRRAILGPHYEAFSSPDPAMGKWLRPLEQSGVPKKPAVSMRINVLADRRAA